MYIYIYPMYHGKRTLSASDLRLIKIIHRKNVRRCLRSPWANRSSSVRLLLRHCFLFVYLIGGLEHVLFFHIYIYIYVYIYILGTIILTPNWRSHIFQRGRLNHQQLIVAVACDFSEITSALPCFVNQNHSHPPKMKHPIFRSFYPRLKPRFLAACVTSNGKGQAPVDGLWCCWPNSECHKLYQIYLFWHII